MGREAANKKSIMDVSRIRLKKRTKAGGQMVKASGDCDLLPDKQKINSGLHAPSRMGGVRRGGGEQEHSVQCPS